MIKIFNLKMSIFVLCIFIESFIVVPQCFSEKRFFPPRQMPGKNIEFIVAGADTKLLTFTQDSFLPIELMKDWQGDLIEFFSFIPPEIESMAEKKANKESEEAYYWAIFVEIFKHILWFILGLWCSGLFDRESIKVKKYND